MDALLRLSLFFLITAASPTQSPQPSPRLIYQFPPTPATFIENLTVRPNGHLLLDTFANGSIYALNPFPASPTPSLVAQLPGVNALVGIAQIAPDIYAVGGGNLVRENFSFVAGSMRVFVLDMNAHPPSVKPAAADSLSDITGLNGLTALPSRPGTVLAASSRAGQILRIDTRTGDVAAVIDDVAALGPSADAENIPIGVNGVKVWGGYLYFTNSALGYFGRVKITAEGRADGGIERIAEIRRPGLDHAFDDFDMDRLGNAYVSLHNDSVVKIGRDGRQTVVVQGDGLGDPTSVVVGWDGVRMYVSTAAGGVVAVRIR